MHATAECSFVTTTLDDAGKAAALADELEVCGARIFDLQIALIAFEEGATELWTHDRGFASVPGLRVVDPLAEVRGQLPDNRAT